MSIQNPEVGSQVVPLEAADFDIDLLHKTRELLEECEYKVLDGFVDRDAYGSHGKIEVRPPLTPETRLKLSVALGVTAVNKLPDSLAA